MSEFMSNKTNKIAAIILGAAIGVALVRFFSMPEEERRELISKLKERTNELLSQSGQTVEKVDHFMAEYDQMDENAWIEKVLILKRMFKDLYSDG